MDTKKYKKEAECKIEVFFVIFFSNEATAMRSWVQYNHFIRNSKISEMWEFLIRMQIHRNMSKFTTTDERNFRKFSFQNKEKKKEVSRFALNDGQIIWFWSVLRLSLIFHLISQTPIFNRRN